MRIAPILMLVACGGSGVTGRTPANEPGELAITASAASVAPGRQVFFTASAGGKYATDATWSSSDPSVLTLEGSKGGGAMVTGVAPSTAAITATSEAGSGTVAFAVAERVVVALAVTAGPPSVGVGRDPVRRAHPRRVRSGIQSSAGVIGIDWKQLPSKRAVSTRIERDA